ncbi:MULTISPECIES: 7-cyano-7-deazaguanine synthase [Pantoea]|uniref:7-cyano-7-deazaguanine synthase n=1 Tax=Pantoea TaxID=53335 RepID=UPI000702AFEF|nr:MULTISPECIES: 7-cyano-7-deazaguanine synthase [Pantoea]
MNSKVGLILSGGMDSACLAWWMKPNMAFTINYGQLAAEAEIEASSEICRILQIEHHIISIDCKQLGSGDMAGKRADEKAPATDWWPFRNQMLITFAAMKAISFGIEKLLIGTVKNDSFHKDGTFEFIDAISNLLSLQEGNIIVEAPAFTLDTLDLIKASSIPYEILKLTHSCHKSITPCNNCRGCNKHNQILNDLGRY